MVKQLPIGCEKDAIKPYALGLCARCWHRARRYGVLDNYPRKYPKRVSKEPKTKRLVSIGCDKCKVNSRARGLCNRCYILAYRRNALDQFPKKGGNL